jgi:glycogen operon protein
MDPMARCIGVLLNGQAGPTMGPRGLPIEDDLLLIIFNSHHEVVEFTLPQLPVDAQWTRILDTSAPEAAQEEFSMSAALPINGRSLVVLSLPAAENTE